ncbi:hypothetical protein KMW28_25160 [Flammeovirga yaeyamensis]|uniref:Uncharacterized protein n=1 Tax=Flammeovirga yaeyamensis TaxID=367791 RepID=A0AAX1N9H5_9BACT|nr:hypothetical protein [Flammeovirga yaeyamensis]MBB3699417.1 hypothetical protein [Flammeovirga yaeyamensis]NMF35324.1 hypothetical protein [Flammeovirga yaeyamensis]QWG04184.1 hypothetical protein KMW28_25160 [Flammeovirga yaeyamensis]
MKNKKIIIGFMLIIFLEPIYNQYLRLYNQFKIDEDYKELVSYIINKDRSWVKIKTKNNLYFFLHLDRKSYQIISEGDSLLHSKGEDSLYHKTMDGKMISNEIIYYYPTSWLHELLGDTLDIEGRYGKKPWKQ